MSTVEWIGNAIAAVQVREWVFGGTWEATDLIRVSPGSNTAKYYEIAAGSTTITTVVDNIVTALSALDSSEYPEYAEVTWTRSGNNLVATALSAGEPFAFTLVTKETGGGSADAQTIDGADSSAGTDTTACSGPNIVGLGDNWSTGSIPANGDDIVISTPVSMLHGMTALASVTPASLRIHARFWAGGARIGLPEFANIGTAQQYREYRDRYLQFSTTTLAEIGIGETNGGTSNINLDFQTANVAITVFSTPQTEESGRPALCLKMNPSAAADGALEVLAGSVGVGFFGETGKVTARIGYRTNRDSDAVVTIGRNVTHGATFTQSGGIVEINSATTAINKTGGTLTINGTGAHPTLNNYAGEVNYNSTGALGASAINLGSAGILNFTRDMSPKTVSSVIQAVKDAQIFDDHGVVQSGGTPNLAFKAVNCQPGDVKFRGPFNRTLTVS